MKKTLCVSAVLLVSLAVRADGPLTLSPETEIVIDRAAPATTRLAAEELKTFLGKSFGGELRIVSAPSGKATAVVLGSNHWSRTEGGIRTETLARDAFVIRTAPGRIYVAGRDDPSPELRKRWQYDALQECATLFGVYELLERWVGVRFYFPGELGTVVPTHRSVTVPVQDKTYAPAFSMRRFGVVDDGDDLPVEQKGLEFRRLRMETEQFVCCHGMNKLRLWERFGKAHPEYFALNAEGVRDGSGGHICWSSAVWDRLFEDAVVALRDEGKPYFDVNPQDGLTVESCCHCPECMKGWNLKDPRNFASEFVWGKVVAFANRVSKAGIKGTVTFEAYVPCEHIPSVEIPANLAVMTARRGPWGEIDPKLQAEDDAEVRAWAAKVNGKIRLWNYVGKIAFWKTDYPGIPHVTPRSIAAYYKRLAPCLHGAFFESESDRWMFNYLNYYVFSRVCWDPAVDVEQVLAEHHRLMFGPAKAELARFFDVLEEKWTKGIVGKPTVSAYEGPGTVEVPTDRRLVEEIYSPQTMAELAGLLKTAETKVGKGTLFARRVQMVRDEFYTPLKGAIDAKCAAVAAGGKTE